MAPTWLNFFTNSAGVWQPGQDDWLELLLDQAINPPGATLRLYETSRSGFATLSPSGGQVMTWGDAEVFVRIGFTNNTFTYLSGPSLHLSMSATLPTCVSASSLRSDLLTR